MSRQEEHQLAKTIMNQKSQKGKNKLPKAMDDYLEARKKADVQNVLGDI